MIKEILLTVTVAVPSLFGCGGNNPRPSILTIDLQTFPGCAYRLDITKGGRSVNVLFNGTVVATTNGTGTYGTLAAKNEQIIGNGARTIPFPEGNGEHKDNNDQFENSTHTAKLGQYDVVYTAFPNEQNATSIQIDANGPGCN